MPVTRASRLRVSVFATALVLVGVSSARAQGDQRDDPPVILYATVSTDGATVHVSGIDIPDEPFVTLGGILLGGVTVVREPDVDRLTALMPAVPPGSYRLRLHDRLPGGDDEDTEVLVSFDITIGIAKASPVAPGTLDDDRSRERPRRE